MSVYYVQTSPPEEKPSPIFLLSASGKDCSVFTILGTKIQRRLKQLRGPVRPTATRSCRRRCPCPGTRSLISTPRTEPGPSKQRVMVLRDSPRVQKTLCKGGRVTLTDKISIREVDCINQIGEFSNMLERRYQKQGPSSLKHVPPEPAPPQPWYHC